MTLVTQQLLQNNPDLKFYENIEIKRKVTATTWENSWLDVTKYLLATSATKITKRLDYEASEFGNFINSNAVFQINNISGDWNDSNDNYSLFAGYYSRNYTRIRYKAGYYGKNNVKINELVFEGLINERTMKINYNDGQLQFTALSYSQILKENIIGSGDLSGATTIKDIIAVIMSYSNINNIINYDATKINPETNISFDNISYYELRDTQDVISELCKKSNSIWYIDVNNYLVIRDRTIILGSYIDYKPNKPILFVNDGGQSFVNANYYTATFTDYAFEFKGGVKQSIFNNIIEIKSSDDGFQNIINSVQYTNDANVYLNEDNDQDNLNLYGTNLLLLEGNDLTNSITINSISNSIINKKKIPKKRMIITTVYMPNVIDYYDSVTVEYNVEAFIDSGQKLLVFNGGTYFNNDYYFGYYKNRMLLKTDIYYGYLGYMHDIKNMKTYHYLVQS